MKMKEAEQDLIELLESIKNGNKNDSYLKISKFPKKKILSIILWIQDNPHLTPINHYDFTKSLYIRI